MQNTTTEPGQIPEWREKLKNIPAHQRQRLAVSIGVSDRTIAYWLAGKVVPKAYARERIMEWGKV